MQTTGASEDPFVQAERDLEEQIREYEAVQKSGSYQSELAHLDRLTQDFLKGISAAVFAFTRYPDGHNWLLQTFTDDFLESSVSVRALAREGVFNVGRREMRYMVEAAVKYVFVDQQVPGPASVAERIGVLGDTSKVTRSSVDQIDQIRLRMLPDEKKFRDAVHSAFGNLSRYTHLSRTQLDERLRRADQGEYSGFENAATLGAFSRLLFQVYDLVLTLVFEGIGPSFTGDLFIQTFDDIQDWKYHKGRFVSQVSASFDYKAERQRRGRA